MNDLNFSNEQIIVLVEKYEARLERQSFHDMLQYTRIKRRLLELKGELDRRYYA